MAAGGKEEQGVVSGTRWVELHCVKLELVYKQFFYRRFSVLIEQNDLNTLFVTLPGSIVANKPLLEINFLEWSP